jgi:hypothetical protein
VTKLHIKEGIVTMMSQHGIQGGHVFLHLLFFWRDSGGLPGRVSRGIDTQQTHFKGVTLHLLARMIAWSPAPADMKYTNTTSKQVT